jgi:hypothetical protein
LGPENSFSKISIVRFAFAMVCISFWLVFWFIIWFILDDWLVVCFGILFLSPTVNRSEPSPSRGDDDGWDFSPAPQEGPLLAY